MNPKKDVNISIRLGQEAADHLRQVAEKEERSLSAVARRALLKGIER